VCCAENGPECRRSLDFIGFFARCRSGCHQLVTNSDIVRGFGVPAVVAINRFPSDSDADLATVRDYCTARGAASGLSEVFARSAVGGLDLATKVVAAANSGTANPQSIYTAETPLDRKLESVAQRVYGAEGVQLSDTAKEKCARFTALCFGGFPVCIAKTPMSFTDDPKRLGGTDRMDSAHHRSRGLRRRRVCRCHCGYNNANAWLRKGLAGDKDGSGPCR